jgi:hypothetical protein
MLDIKVTCGGGFAETGSDREAGEIEWITVGQVMQVERLVIVKGGRPLPAGGQLPEGEDVVMWLARSGSGGQVIGERFIGGDELVEGGAIVSSGGGGRSGGEAANGIVEDCDMVGGISGVYIFEDSQIGSVQRHSCA